MASFKPACNQVNSISHLDSYFGGKEHYPSLPHKCISADLIIVYLKCTGGSLRLDDLFDCCETFAVLIFAHLLLSFFVMTN